MHPTLQELHQRKSVRAFTDQPVTSETKQALFQAAFQAPTAGCQQLYTILDITDADLKKSLSVSCDNQPFIATAPLVLLFCADCKKWYDGYLEAGCTPRKPGVGDLLLAVSDANVAAQNLVVAAQALGLGSCYIGDVMEHAETHRALLNLPQWVFPAAMLVLGYPTQQQQDRPKPQRFAPEFLVHENGYHSLDGAQLRTMLAQRSGEVGYEGFMTAFCQRKYDSDFSREMTRSVATYLQDFQGE